jgi:inner membrane transporter RhtA
VALRVGAARPAPTVAKFGFVSAAELTHRAGAVVLTGPPSRPRPRRVARAVAGFAPQLAGPACIVASCASLQTASALATTVFAAFGPAGTGALRFLLGAVVLLALVRPRLRGRSAKAWLAIAASGGAMAATNFCLYEAIARIPLGVATTLVFLGPLGLALLGARRRLDLAWALAAMAGVLLLAGGPTGGSLAGAAFALGAAISVAAAVLTARRVGSQTTGLDGLALSIAAAALLTLPIGLRAAIASPQLEDLGIVAAVGVLGIALPYALEFTALRRVGVKTYGILLSLDPAVAGAAGLLLLGQHLDSAELLGMGSVMLASAGAVATRPVSGP